MASSLHLHDIVPSIGLLEGGSEYSFLWIAPYISSAYVSLSADSILTSISWTVLLSSWRIEPKGNHAQRLSLNDAQLGKVSKASASQARFLIVPAKKTARSVRTTMSAATMTAVKLLKTTKYAVKDRSKDAHVKESLDVLMAKSKQSCSVTVKPAEALKHHRC